MNLQQTLDHYYQVLTQPDKNTVDPRLNTYFLDIQDLAMLIDRQLQEAIEQQLLPAIHFKIHCLKQEAMAFIVITITGGLDDFPIYTPHTINQWRKNGIPKQNGIIETAWYSEEFQCLEKILNHFCERYNYRTDAQRFAAKRYWTMSEIDEDYEQTLMLLAIQTVA